MFDYYVFYVYLKKKFFLILLVCAFVTYFQNIKQNVLHSDKSSLKDMIVNFFFSFAVTAIFAVLEQHKIFHFSWL